MKVHSLSSHPHRPSHSPALQIFRGPRRRRSQSQKAHWSPNSFGATDGGNVGNTRNAFSNCGYSPRSSLSRGQFGRTASNGFGGASYSNPSLTIDTNTGGNTGLPSRLGPNPGVTFAQQTQIPSVPTPTLHTSASATTCWAWTSRE